MTTQIFRTILIFLTSCLFSFGNPFLGNGIKIGEVRQTSAVVWARLTSVASGDSTSQTKAAPGASGSFKVTYHRVGEKRVFLPGGLVTVSSDHDFAGQVTLSKLLPGTKYEIQVTAQSPDGKASDTRKGTFKTAPAPDQVAPVTGVIVTCQGIGTVDDERKGHRAYEEILKHQPDFLVHAGDIVYYDKDYKGKQPLSKSIPAARQRWNRMFSYQWNQDFHRHLGSYFMKDDHDTLDNDSWPGRRYGKLTFEDGLAIFKEQLPHSPLPYRTVSWGKDLQIWLLEGRDFRSPNNIPDGPEKTVLGAEQKAWLKKSLRESEATFKLVMSPTPIIGPDKRGKKDNLANAVFQTEGDEIRNFLKTIPNLYILCGDRHWQYASQDPATGLKEFCPGPINDDHAKLGGNSGKKKNHLYFGGGKGGFLLFKIHRDSKTPVLDLEWHRVKPKPGINHRMRIEPLVATNKSKM